MTHGPPLRLLAITTLAAAAACTLAVDADRRQCAVDKDCVGHGLSSRATCVSNVCVEPRVTIVLDAGADADAGPTDPIWGCLGNLPALPAEEPTEVVHYKTAFQNVLTSERLAGLPVKGCLLTDPECSQPVPGSTTESSEGGQVDVALYSGFRGYLDISPPASNPDFMPSIVQVIPIPNKVRPSGESGVIWGLLTKSQMKFVAASAGKEILDDYGHVFFFATHCGGLSAKDVVARAEPVTAQTYTFYTDSAGTPSLTQNKTTDNGNGGYLNLPVGPVTLTLNRENGQRVGSQTVIIRKGTITYLNFGPSP